MPALQQQQAAQSTVAANIAAAADPCPVEAPLLLHQGAVPQHSTGEQVVEKEATAAASAALLAEDSITLVPCSLPDACAEANTAAVRMLPADSVTAGVLTNGPCASVAHSGSSNVFLAGSTSTIAAAAPAGNTSANVQPAAWRLVREHLEDVLQAYCKVCEEHPYEQCIEFSASDVCRHLSPQATLLSTLGLGQAGAAAGALDGPNNNHDLASENSAHGGGDGAVALPLAVCGSGVQAEVQRILEYLTQLQGAPKCPQTGAYTPSLVFDADEGKFYTC